MIFKAKSYNILKIQAKTGGRGPLGPSPESAYDDGPNLEIWSLEKAMFGGLSSYIY